MPSASPATREQAPSTTRDEDDIFFYSYSQGKKDPLPPPFMRRRGAIDWPREETRLRQRLRRSAVHHHAAAWGRPTPDRLPHDDDDASVNNDDDGMTNGPHIDECDRTRAERHLLRATHVHPILRRLRDATGVLRDCLRSEAARARAIRHRVHRLRRDIGVAERPAESFDVEERTRILEEQEYQSSRDRLLRTVDRLFADDEQQPLPMTTDERTREQNARDHWLRVRQASVARGSVVWPQLARLNVAERRRLRARGEELLRSAFGSG